MGDEDKQKAQYEKRQDGTPVISSVRDVEGPVQYEKALNESGERMRRLIDALPVCISYIDRDLRYRLNNKTQS